MDTISIIEREKSIVDHYISLKRQPPTTVIPWECVENLQESLDIIQSQLAQGNCPAERVNEMIICLEEGHETLEWLKQHLATDSFMEYARLGTDMTGLKVEIFVDDGGAYLRNQHSLWAYARDGYYNQHEYVRIVVSDPPNVLDQPRHIATADLNKTVEFIKHHAALLHRLANGDLTHQEFYPIIQGK